MTNLLARLNTLEGLKAATAEEKKHGAGIYVDFSDESDMYRQGTFKKVIDAILEQAFDSGEQTYRNVAEAVKSDLSQQGPGIDLHILVYDPKNDTYLRNVADEESVKLDLDDYVKDYIIEKELDGNEESKKVDYLDIVVNLNPKVGGKWIFHLLFFISFLKKILSL